MITNKDIRVEGSKLIINGEKHPLDPAVDTLIKRANTVQGKLSALDTKITAIEALEKSASGNPISLTGAAEAYAMGLSMAIEPIQSGSGDPSPTNVRPISGLTSGEVQTTNGTDTNTATITFGQTVYGGSVNFKTGEVTVTHGIVDLGTLTDWEYAGRGTDNGYVYKVVSFTTIPRKLLNCAGLSNKLFQYNNTSYASTKINSFNLGHYTVSLFVGSAIDTLADFKTAMSGVQLCYELATPTTLTLTPAELELLKGSNIISGNGVNINIGYIGR